MRDRRFEMDPEVLERFLHLGRQLIKWNRKTNLTSIDDLEGYLFRHVLDSLLPLLWGWESGQGFCCDIGSGNGFPGLAWLALDLEQKWMFCDSNNKKIKWLEHAVRILEKPETCLLDQRAENAGRDERHREKYDLCLSRALAQPVVMLEYCLPFVKPGGELLCWLGEDEDRQRWDKALETLGGREEERKAYFLYRGEEGWILLEQKNLPQRHPVPPRRFIARIRKISQTPLRYPRRVGLPAKRPL